MSAEHAVIVKFRYGFDSLDRLSELEDKLTNSIGQANVGEFDGNEIAVDLSHGSLYMYGPNADLLLAVVLPILRSEPFMKGAVCICRYGSASDLSAREERIDV